MWLALALAALAAWGAACSTTRNVTPAADDDAADDDAVKPAVGAAVAGSAEYWPPDEMGPYPVGVITVQTVDKSRWELWGLQYRGLPLEIWYPSTGKSGTPNTMTDMVGEFPEYAWPILALVYGNQLPTLLGIVTSAKRGDDPATSDGPFPVLFFSHGVSAIRFQNYTLCEHLASHGFIVVAPDHYDSAIFSNLGNGDLVIFNLLTWVTGIVDRPLDVNFIHSYLEDLPAGDDIVNKIPFNKDKFAVLGHSYGGITSMQAGPMYPEYVQAIAPLNPAWIGAYPQNYTAPFFMLQSSDDEIVGGDNPYSLRAFEEAASTKKVYVNLKLGSHYSATDACALLPSWMITPERGCGSPIRIDSKLANKIAAAYLTAYFRAVMNGDDRYLPYLLANHFPDDIEFGAQWR